MLILNVNINYTAAQYKCKTLKFIRKTRQRTANIIDRVTTPWKSQGTQNCTVVREQSGKIGKNQGKLEMWANAQRDGRLAEYRWRPLFNAAKFGCCAL